jgi:hypothetical protein
MPCWGVLKVLRGVSVELASTKTLPKVYNKGSKVTSHPKVNYFKNHSEKTQRAAVVGDS